MTTTRPTHALLPAKMPPPDQPVLREAQAVIARARPRVDVERRRSARIAFPYLMRLTPLDDSGSVAGDAMVVVGKEIAERGLGFYHEHPLPYRRALVTLDHPHAGYFSAELDITWCRFTAAGWYESGGRIVQWVEAGDASDLPASA